MKYTEIHMSNENIFQDVQREFTALYPFLKIDFFKTGNRAERIYPEERIRRFARKVHCGIVNIDGYRTVAQVVKDVQDMFLLSAMILRRSGNVWIETSLTAGWTLEQQNREGEHISRLS